MARPGFRQHPKFKRLVHTIREPVPHVWGYLECMWEVGYQSGNPVLGDALDVELAAEYPGEKGELCKALLDCRLIDQLDDGRFAIHDLLENAPGFVASRAEKNEERKKEKVCLLCQEPYHSGETHSKYCSPACRVAHFRSRQSDAVTNETNGNEGVRNSNAQKRALTDLTAQHSTAQHSTDTPPKAPRMRGAKAGEVIAPGFVEFWQSYPRKTAKAAATKAWNKLAPNEGLRALIQAALERQKRSPQWTKDDGQFIPHPATWLNGRRWEDADVDSTNGDDERLRRFVETGSDALFAPTAAERENR